MSTQTIIIPRDPLAVFAQHDATTLELLAELRVVRQTLAERDYTIRQLQTLALALFVLALLED